MYAVLDCRMRCVQLFYGISLQCTTTRSLQRKMKERTSQQNTHTHTFSSLQTITRGLGSSSDQHPLSEASRAPPPSAPPLHLHVTVQPEMQQKPQPVPQPPPYPPASRFVEGDLARSRIDILTVEVMEFSNIISNKIPLNPATQTLEDPKALSRSSKASFQTVPPRSVEVLTPFSPNLRYLEIIR